MRVQAPAVAFLALPALAFGVALSDMSPRAENLPSACEAVYTEQISGCADSDFATGKCSPSCINALNNLVSPIKQACGNQGLSGSNLVVAFLANVGPQQICKNIGGSSSTTTTAAPSSSTTQSPSAASSTTTTTEAQSSSATTAKSSQTAPPSSSAQSSASTKHHSTTTTATSSTGSTIVFDTSSTPSAAIGFASTSTATTAAASSNPQENFNDGSGGGSPFDSPGNLASAATSTWAMGPVTSLLLSTSAAMALALLLR